MKARALLAAFLTVIAAAGAGAAPRIDLGAEAIRRGREVFQSACQACHALRYLGVSAQMPPADAKAAFGKEPPDLSLMAAARGRGSAGAEYVAGLLLAYTDTAEKNSVFPGIAMPEVFAKGDPEAARKSADVAAFLYYASDPAFRERERLGLWVIGYMAVLTALLYLVYRRTWSGLKAGKEGR